MSATTVPEINPALKSDFPDSLSPIVVKELRQSLRSSSFIGLFCCILASLLAITLLQWWAGENEIEEFAHAFWLATIVALVVLVPMRAFNALSGEMRSDTFHLLQLTSLSSLRIVLGKWAATLALNALVAITIVPFFVFRYFSGGVDLVFELRQLAMVACVGAMVIAFAVAFSAHRAFLVRAFAFLVTGILPALVFIVYVVDGDIVTLATFDVVMIFVGALLFGAYALLMGAANIATGDENYSMAKRVLALSTMAVNCVVDFWFVGDPMTLNAVEQFQWFLAVLFLCDCATEAPRYSSGIVHKALGTPLVGRVKMLRRLCYPGWNTVHVFVVPVVLMLILTQREPGMPESNPWLFYDVLLTCACTLFPTAIIQAHPGRSIDRFVGRYVLIGCLMCAYSIIFIAMTAGREYELEVTPAVFFGSVVTPMSSVMMGQRQYITSILSDGGDSHSIYLVGACVSIVWYLVILLKAMLVNARVAAAEAIAKGKASVSSHSDWQAMQSRPPGP